MKSHTILYPDAAGKRLEGMKLLQFWMRIDVKGPDECWPWTAGENGIGYGQFRLDGKMLLSHRIAYSDVNGEIGKGQVVRHTCHTSLCCNPDHLIPGTQKQNIHDAIQAGRFKPVDGKLGAAANRVNAAARKLSSTA